MTSAALFILAVQAAAITIVFVRGSIFERVRDNGPRLWQELTSCPLCAGVWIGFGWSLLSWFRSLGTPASLETLWEKLRSEWLSVALDTLAVGALTGTLALFIEILLNFLVRDDEHHHHDHEDEATPDTSDDAAETKSDETPAAISVDVAADPK